MMGLALCLVLLVIALGVVAYTYYMWSGVLKVVMREVIEIFFCPPPTKSSSEPMTSTMRRAASARRVGARKIGGMKRDMTRVYNPTLHGHCGYQAALVAAGKVPSKKAVLDLRKKVSVDFVQGALEDREEAGLRLRELVRHEGLTLKAYAAAVERDLWASPAELAIAARILKTNFFVIYKTP